MLVIVEFKQSSEHCQKKSLLPFLFLVTQPQQTLNLKLRIPFPIHDSNPSQCKATTSDFVPFVVNSLLEKSFFEFLLKKADRLQKSFLLPNKHRLQCRKTPELFPLFLNFFFFGLMPAGQESIQRSELHCGLDCVADSFIEKISLFHGYLFVLLLRNC